MKKEKFEMKLYECLGVKQFQSLVFALERVIHFKDKGKNINYHIKESNIDQLKEFQKYLYFNGFIHVRNNIILAGVLVLQQLFLSDLLLIYMIPAMIKNTYCVMLQRYNYLRINKVIEAKKKMYNRKIEKKQEKFVEKHQENIEKVKSNEKSLEHIENLKRFLNGEEDVILDETSVETLSLIRDFLKSENKNNVMNEQSKGAYKKKIGGN